MKKSLIVCSHCPLPETTGGNMRTMNFARRLKKYGTVDIVYSFLADGANPGSGFFKKEYFLEKREYPKGFIRRCNLFLKGQPYPIRNFGVKEKQALLQAVSAENYDYILIRYAANAYGFLGLPRHIKSKIILDFDDHLTGTLYQTLHKQSDNIFKKLVWGLNKRRLKHYESRCLRLNVSLFCSEKDRQEIGRSNPRAFVVPNTYANEAFDFYDFSDGFKNGKVLLFVGTLSYGPNSEGLKWFVRSVYPKLKEKHPDASLLVVGHLSDSDDYGIRACCQSATDIELHTNVVDVRDFYRRCSAVVVPLWQGGGTRIKILEAIKADRPVLSTAIGLEGLELKAGEDVLVFQDADEFVENFDLILNSPVYSKLTRNAREIVDRKYRMEDFNQAFDMVLSQIDGSR